MHFRLTVVLSLLFCHLGCAVAQPKAQIDETAFDFVESVQQTPIQHEFRLRNMGGTALRIAKVALTPPLNVKAWVAPDEVCDEPTTTPEVLIPCPKVNPPPSVPRSMMEPLV